MENAWLNIPKRGSTYPRAWYNVPQPGQVSQSIPFMFGNNLPTYTAALQRLFCSKLFAIECFLLPVGLAILGKTTKLRLKITFVAKLAPVSEINFDIFWGF